jgi:hypothetical protein
MSINEEKNLAPKTNRHDLLDAIKHRLSCEVLERFPISKIREHSRANLERWKAHGNWGPTYDEWLGIIEANDDYILVYRMVGLDEESNRLRQSMPYVGMLDQSIVRQIHEEYLA